MKKNTYEEMDPELRKEVARDSVKKTTVMRLLIAALLVGVTVYFKLSGVAAVVMILVAIFIVLTMVPVWLVVGKNMKDEDEEPEAK